MAKKRKGKSSQSRSRGGGSQRTGTVSRASRPAGKSAAAPGPAKGEGAPKPEVKVPPAEPGGPNRLTRKEEARRQRERLRKRMARKRRMKRALAIGGAVAGVALLVFVLSRPTASLSEEEQRLLDQAPAAVRAAGCGRVDRIDPYPGGQDQTHIGNQLAQMPAFSTYPSQPPASGPHAGTTLQAGVYDTPPPMDRLIHSMEHGAVVVWYSPDAPEAQIDQLTEFFRDPEHHDHVIVAPYNYPAEGEAGQLPQENKMVLVAWHRMQTCNDLSLPAAFSFVHNFATSQKADYKGEAPEAGAPI